MIEFNNEGEGYEGLKGGHEGERKKLIYLFIRLYM